MKVIATTRYNFLLVFFVALGSFTYGFNSSIMGTVFGLPSFYSYFNLDTTGPKVRYANDIIGATQGLYSGGGIFGCCLIAWLADKLGRKRAVQLVCTICVVSAILQAAAVHIGMLLVGRFFNGLGAGMMNVVVPLYQSEISPPGNRGRLVGSHGFLIVVGYSVAGWTGLGCYFETDPEIQWRLCLALQVVAPLLLFVGTPWMPESPRWLIQHQHDEKALEILCNLHCNPDDTENTAAREECHNIRSQLQLDATMPQGMIATLKVPSYRKRFLIGLFVQCVAQSTGVLVINNYQILLYKGLGITGWLPLMPYAIYASWAAILNWAGSMVVDRVGRIRMLTIGVVGCGLMVSCEAAMVATYGGTSNRVGNGFGVLFLFVFVTFYGSCVDAISYVYCSEIFPTSLRAQGMGFSIIGLFAMTLIYTQSAPTAFAHIGWRFYLVFILVPIGGAPVMYFFFPETKGLSLEEVGQLFGDEVSEDMTQEQYRNEKQEVAGTKMEQV
ncbi:general substrate transporter [Melanomma pulvis-pyrius CBS 109.77]|uniref:General substrate transporter n=1 Tax=Melanomma pulvis-pyrius CBS 109.77 TaxID=1314802 RepID=A0A6A6X7C2_9PLEO|nr:general substrate transporter [Melanomma pulvis-pyrius CBS 109.77]